MVLKADSHTAAGRMEEPTVLKLDSASRMVDEVKRTEEIGELVGDEAIRVMRGPVYADRHGDAIDISIATVATASSAPHAPHGVGKGAVLTESDFGAVVLEMAGACWVLPEFFGRIADVQLIATFKQGLVRSSRLRRRSQAGASRALHRRRRDCGLP